MRQWLSKDVPKLLRERAQMVLLAAEGWSTQDIARTLGTRPARVSRWRTRYAQLGLAGLRDAPRPGKPRAYGMGVVERILKQLEQAPPKGQSTWTGALVAQALGGVSAEQVWRILRQQGIRLRRGRAWCIDTEPEFLGKAIEMGGLFVRPTERALVVFARELPRPGLAMATGGALRVPERQMLRHFSPAAAGQGRLGLRGALEAAAQLVGELRFRSRRRREMGDFLRETWAARAGREMHVVLDQPRGEARAAYADRFPSVHWHFARGPEAWLSQVKVWLSLVSRGGPRAAREITQALDRLISSSADPEAAPFEWSTAK